MFDVGYIANMSYMVDMAYTAFTAYTAQASYIAVLIDMVGLHYRSGRNSRYLPS